MGRSDPQGEEDDSVQQRNSQQTIHFGQTGHGICRRALLLQPPTLPLLFATAIASLLLLIKTDSKRSNRRVLQVCTIIQRSKLLFLFVDLRYDIPPPHPRTLRGVYGYLPDR